MPYLINEDQALKELLKGITVSDSGNPQRPVGVFYGQPDKEIRDQAFPYITIDLVGIAEDRERAHRGYITLPYTPEGVDPQTPYATQYPIPVTLSYQVTTFARQPRHDRQIINALFAPSRLPLRFGLLAIPEDGTVRRLDVVGFVKRDTTEQEKRLFSNVYNIQISSEFLRDELNQLYPVLEQPIITYKTHPNSIVEINL